ncbi:MAG: HDOD domain-containing protein [Gemmatimonadetes bacterium]|nr:HDOD domain-containing protein [Gemmatimonadota bacterium]
MIRILFVDDEPHVLDGLRRMLRTYRSEWDMTFVQSGEEAVTAMAAGPFEIVVSDMKMPGMSGTELLSKVKEAHSETVRMVLSGQASRDEVLKVVSPAHQYMAKPCGPDDLKATIEQAIALRRLLSSRELAAVVSGIVNLPSIPSLYQALVEELNKPEPSIAKIGEIVEQDPAMTAKILRLVNSAFFGLRREVSRISDAVSYLGTDTISTLVLSQGLFQQFDPNVVSSGELDALWSHSMRTSRLAAAVAKSCDVGRDVVDHAFTAGMLHEVGKLVFASSFPERWKEARAALAAGEAHPSVVEREILGATHGEMGAYLLGLWGLPDPIVEAVAFHPVPSDHVNPSLDALSIVHVADVLAGATSSREDTMAQLDHDYLAAVGVAGRIEGWMELAAETLQMGSAA